VDISTIVDMDELKSNYSDAWIDLGSVDGTLYGVWYRASMKSLVWYPVPEFEDAGYTIPETWDELIALSDQMVADGGVPWCIGMESATATGWVGTDWIEDIMLRTAGGEKYDQWVAGELKFDSPEVRRAFELAGEIFFNPDYVLGGTTAILTTPFGDAPTPMFDDPPGCWLHRQASFIAGFFPEDVQADLAANVNAFYLPPIDEDKGSPVLGAGDVFAITSDRPEVAEFLRFLATPEAAEGWAKAGGFLSPNGGVPLDWYPDEITRVQAGILTSADVFRFDGSDLMPGAVGTGSFWTEIVNWVSGQDLDSTLQAIDASWPQ
jgi:alpha-glucoside transport system substrate-binding protein